MQDYTTLGMSQSSENERDLPIKKQANIKLLKSYINEINIADKLDDGLLSQMGRQVVEDAEKDDKTRAEWFDIYNEALKIAKQTIETKSFPFDKASNVKIPLILQGCIQFNSRLMPEIVRDGKTVRCASAGAATEVDEMIAKQISDHMSLQTLNIMPNWIGDTDKLIMALALVGTIFRKIIYDPINRRPSTYVCLPTEIIIDNEVTSLETAQRITHVIKMTRNEIVEKMRAGLYREIPLRALDEGYTEGENKSDDEERVLPSDMEDSSNYYVIYEQSCFWDLDEDGYAEPYTITVNKKTSDVMRIVARYADEDLVFKDNDQKELIKINAIQNYAAYMFLPSPDGTFLGMGLGQLLLPINAAANSITNNLIDAGTLANIRGGFLGKDLRIPKGDLSFNAGEWKMVNNTMGQPLQNSIYPLPISEPSQTLMSLLQFLLDFGKQIANVSDILMGNPISAQMPATSVVTLVQQGAKVFSSILSRIYEGLKSEFKILYALNRKYISLYPQKDLMIKNGFISEATYAMDRYNIYPVANPAMGTDAVALAKMQVLMERFVNDPDFNAYEIKRRFMEVLGIGDIDKIMLPPPQKRPPAPPAPQELLIQSQTELNNAMAHEKMTKMMLEHEQEGFRNDIEEKKIQVDANYKGGMLAIGKGDTIARTAVAEATVGDMNIRKAQMLVDKEQQTSMEIPQFDNTSQNDLTNQQGMGYPGQNSQMPGQDMGQGGQQPQQSEQSQLNLPPELEQMLQGVAQEQQKGQSGQ